jgi:hypothetical protein
MGKALPQHVVKGLEPTHALRHMGTKKKRGGQFQTQGHRSNKVNAGRGRRKTWASTKRENGPVIEYRAITASGPTR